MKIILKGIKSSLDYPSSGVKDLFAVKKNYRKYSFHNSCDIVIVQLEFKKDERTDYRIAVRPLVALPPPFVIPLLD
jgi:hypothetical protein